MPLPLSSRHHSEEGLISAQDGAVVPVRAGRSKNPCNPEVVDVADLAYCSALGDTLHDAVSEVEAVIAAWLEAATSSARAMPPPSTRMTQAQVLAE